MGGGERFREDERFEMDVGSCTRHEAGIGLVRQVRMGEVGLGWVRLGLQGEVR